MKNKKKILSKITLLGLAKMFYSAENQYARLTFEILFYTKILLLGGKGEIIICVYVCDMCDNVPIFYLSRNKTKISTVFCITFPNI